jgi:hypothetical protein
VKRARVHDFAGEALEAEWNNPVCKRIVHIEDETGNTIANDIPLDDYILTSQYESVISQLPTVCPAAKLSRNSQGLCMTACDTSAPTALLRKTQRCAKSTNNSPDNWMQ